VIDARDLPVFSLEVDADRDSTLEPGEPGHWDWRWSPEGPGAIALPDLGQGDGAHELTPARLVIERAPAGTVVLLGLNNTAAPFVTVYRATADGRHEAILGRIDEGNARRLVPFTTTVDLFVRPRQLPGLGFDGVIELTALSARELPDGGFSVSGTVDRAVMRVAPWIITPDTCAPRRVFAVIVPIGATGANKLFRKELKAACETAKVPVTFLDLKDLPNYAKDPYDRWIQDEIEFGYVARGGRSGYDNFADGGLRGCSFVASSAGIRNGRVWWKFGAACLGWRCVRMAGALYSWTQLTAARLVGEDGMARVASLTLSMSAIILLSMWRPTILSG
jgi:hypothetical protein